MTSSAPQLRIAVVSSGVHHVMRGIETWAVDLAAALSERGVHVALYGGSGPAVADYEKTVWCLRRGSKLNAWISRWSPRSLWRWHLTSTYSLEQLSFALALYVSGQARRFDVIHTQDPVVATVLERLRRAGLLRAKTLLAHGTEEPFTDLARYQYLQHLAPFHLEEASAYRPENGYWIAVPNFVDLEVFAPRADSSIRERLEIPEDAMLVLCVAAIKRDHKRIDYLISEFARYCAGGAENAHLLVAGASHSDTPQLEQQADAAAPGRIHFLIDRPRAEMPAIFNAADLFVMTSLKEMMPIALLEAIGSGLPCIVSSHPVVSWMIGDGGESIEMAEEGALAEALCRWTDPSLRAQGGTRARQHAEAFFSRRSVVDRLCDVYQEVAE